MREGLDVRSTRRPDYLCKHFAFLWPFYRLHYRYTFNFYYERNDLDEEKKAR